MDVHFLPTFRLKCSHKTASEETDGLESRKGRPSASLVPRPPSWRDESSGGPTLIPKESQFRFILRFCQINESIRFQEMQFTIPIFGNWNWLISRQKRDIGDAGGRRVRCVMFCKEGGVNVVTAADERSLLPGEEQKQKRTEWQNINCNAVSLSVRYAASRRYAFLTRPRLPTPPSPPPPRILSATPPRRRSAAAMWLRRRP